MTQLSAIVRDGRVLLSRGDVSTFEGFVDDSRVTEASVAASGDCAFVLVEPVGESWKPAENLVAVAADGAPLWRAELPTYSGGDRYVAVDVALDGGLMATSWSGYRVALDTTSGRILRREFVK